MWPKICQLSWRGESDPPQEFVLLNESDITRLLKKNDCSLLRNADRPTTDQADELLSIENISTTVWIPKSESISACPGGSMPHPSTLNRTLHHLGLPSSLVWEWPASQDLNLEQNQVPRLR